MPFGVIARPQALCPVCGALDRHRLIYLYFIHKTNLFCGDEKTMLHIAPESQLSRVFQDVDYIDYLSADLSSPSAMVKMDITNIDYPDCSFDVIYCSHVLEHVSDDSKAMRELHRVLKADGWAILQVPISGETTFEDPTVTSREMRERLFGQNDHLRQYGRDFADRLGTAGFHVSVDGFVRELSERQIIRLGLPRDEDIYFCTK
jgi:SAM-dependent methyltransferase